LGDFFAVPGDFNLVLLDELLKQPGLRMIGCCNELNAAYAADGYARVRGFGMVAVTYMVGGLSAINAIAGAYAEDQSVLIVSGGPNTNDAPAHHLIHHTIGETDLYQASACFQPVVGKTIVIRHLDQATQQIDEAIWTCLQERKPVYLEIACNLASAGVCPPGPLVMPPPRPSSDPASLEAAIAAAATHLAASVKPVLVAGVKLGPSRAVEAFLKLADALGCAIAAMPNAKGLLRESHPAFLGTYWGTVSDPCCAEIVESSDCQIFAGPVFNDYTTVGWTALIRQSNGIVASPFAVQIAGRSFSRVGLADFLEGLAARVVQKPASLQALERLREPRSEFRPEVSAQPLTLREWRGQVQALLGPETELVVETGDSWFNGQKLRLPDGAGYHFQMQYGSIGWATGATLGVTIGAGPTRRVVALIGDGSFQLSAQEVSTMIRYQTNPILFLLNNRGYTIEVEIHDGPYNTIKNWDYAGLVEVFNAGEGNGLGLRATTGEELAAAIARAKRHPGLVLIECRLDRDDCTRELLEWGSRVARANSRPPGQIV